MLQIKTLYSLPATSVVLSEDLLRSDWFYEVPSLSRGLNDSVLEQLKSDARFEVRCILYRRHDDRRYISMYSFWFDGKPVMLTQNAGREGDDFKRRLITDAALFKDLCGYLHSRLDFDIEVAESDLVDPETHIFEEEAFKFSGGEDFGAAFGYPVQPRTEGYQLLPDATRMLKVEPASLVFVAAQSGRAFPEFLRRHLTVIKKVRPVSASELAVNERLLPHYAEQGVTQFYWYESTSYLPAEDILVI
jgi:hypothetical protein